MTGRIVVILIGLSVWIYGTNALEFTDCGSKVGKFTKVQVSDCVTTSTACILKKNTNATISIDFELSTIDQCTKVTAVVHGVVMGIEMPFNLPNADGCLNSGITCPIQKGSNYEYSTTLPVLKQYPKVKVDVKWELIDENKDVIVCVMIPAKIQ
ncbi:hypothetical protein HA402_009759 [Bradysia odoriphaga]|nr:hypothetical protein HA402_009759 [Bradysia odoriphaga]